MITIVDLNIIPVVEPLISETLYQRMQSVLSQNKKILLSLNRRGAMSILVCHDCGWVARCPDCDLSMRVHHMPDTGLLCHFCEWKMTMPKQCPACQWFHLVESGARIQTAMASLQRLFPDEKILLVEKWVDDIPDASLRNNTIFIGTQKITSLPIENIWLAAFLLVEADLSVPMYDVEEDVYGQVRYCLSRADQMIIQTRVPRHRFLQTLQEKNFRQFFIETLQERKLFGLPPVTSMVSINIGDKHESTLRSRVQTLASTLTSRAQYSPTRVSYDHLLIERRGNMYYQRILIKSENILAFLEEFRPSLVRGRGIEVQWL